MNTWQGVKSIKMFGSLTGVRVLLWLLPYLNILCMRSEKPTTLKLPI